MLHNFSLLPIELQASVTDLRAAGIAESTIDTLVGRMLAAIEFQTNRAQIEVFGIEEKIIGRLETIGGKLAADLRTQHGETNGMLIELRGALMAQGAAAAELRAEFQAFDASLSGWRAGLEQWRGLVDATLASFADSRDESKAERRQIQDRITALDTRHGVQWTSIDSRLAEIERLLEIAGQHDRAWRGTT